MPTHTTIDGVPCTIEKRADGCIRVTLESPQFNAMHGPATEGEMTYLVHPVQRNQYDFVDALLPETERAKSPPSDGPAASASASSAPASRPWWSYTPTPKDKREHSGGE